MPTKKTLRQVIIGVLSVSFVGKLLQILLAISIARLLEPEGYGTYALALALSYVLVRFTNLGWPVTMNRLLPKFSAENNIDAVKGALLSAVCTVSAATAVITLGLVAVSKIFDLNQDTRNVVTCVALIMPFLGFRVLLRNLLAAMGSPRRGLSIEDPIPAAITLAVTGSLLSQNMSVSPIDVALTFGFAGLCSVCIGGFWLHQQLPEGFTQATAKISLKAWLKSSITTMWGQAARMLVNRADLIMLGALSTLETTGLYAVALRLCQLLVLPSNAVQTFIAPRISGLTAENDPSGARSLFRLSLGFALITSAPLALIFWLIADELVTLTFGVDYAAAGGVVMLLAVSKIFMALSNALSSFMLMLAREKLFTRLATLSMAINLGLNAVLIPEYGATGAAISTCVAVFLLCVSQLWYCRSALLGANYEHDV